MITAFKVQLKKKLTRNIDLAISELEAALKVDSSIFNDFILLQSRYNNAKSSFRKGVFTDNSYQVTTNRIRQSLIELIDELREADLRLDDMGGQLEDGAKKAREKKEQAANRNPLPNVRGKKERESALEPKKVFISYSWDNEEHKKWVLDLADSLVRNGVDVLLDRYELRLGRNLAHFMESSIEKADKVILIFTENYKLKAEGRAGGVGYEYSMINEELYRNQISNHKFIPILRKGNSRESIPKFIASFIWLDMSDDRKFTENYETLIREIYDEPKVQKPTLGAKPIFGSGIPVVSNSNDRQDNLDLKDFPWVDKSPFFLETFDATNFDSQIFRNYDEDLWSGKTERGVYKLENEIDENAVRYHYLTIDDQDMSEFPTAIEVKVEAENIYPTPSGGLVFCFDEITKFYYAFIVGNNREYKLWLKGDKGYKTIISGRSNKIYPNEFNKIGVIRSGSSIYLFINDQYERKVKDDTLGKGDVGIIAVGKGAFIFDNLSLYTVPTWT